MRTVFIDLEAVPKGVETIYQAKFNGKILATRKTMRKYCAAMVTIWDHEQFPGDPEAKLEHLAESVAKDKKPLGLQNCWGRPELFIKGGLNNQYWNQENLTVVFALDPELKASLNTWKHC